MLRLIGRWALGKIARHPRWRAFQSWREYYRPFLQADARQALIQHTGPLVGDARQQVELINGMVAGRGPAVVWAPAGCGKSRFAMELARRVERVHWRWRVVFVRHDESAVRDTQIGRQT